MMENAVYSVISPESCAAIIYRDSAKAPLAAAALEDDRGRPARTGDRRRRVPEPAGGAQEDHDAAADNVRLVLRRTLDELAHVEPEHLVLHRYEKFRHMAGFFHE